MEREPPRLQCHPPGGLVMAEDAAAMVMRCLRRQHPECYGGDEISPYMLPPEFYERAEGVAVEAQTREELPPLPMGNGELLPNPEWW